MKTGAFSGSRLKRMREVIERQVEQGAIPGAVALVSRGGETHVGAVGTLAFGSNAPMRRDSVFRIVSVTKPIVAAAAMFLVEECRLRLDEPVDRLLPELADRRVLRRFDAPLNETVPANRPNRTCPMEEWQPGRPEGLASGCSRRRRCQLRSLTGPEGSSRGPSTDGEATPIFSPTSPCHGRC